MKPSLPVSVLTLLVGFCLSGVAAYFSVVGLAMIFSGAYLSTVVMASTLELSKIVAVSWIYRNWFIAPALLRAYMLAAIVILLCITSMGIFGYLSRAHIEQNVSSGDNLIRMQQIENLIANEQRTIDDAQSVVNQLDSAVQSLLQYDRIRGQDGAIAVRQSQKQERQDLSSVISDANARMVELQNEYSALKTTQLKMEAEIGPLKYVAELIYGEDAKAHFDQAVRMIIFVIVIVFDPLAICLIIAGNVGISKRNVLITQKGDYLEVSTNSILNVD